jgi:hypothetical protein
MSDIFQPLPFQQGNGPDVSPTSQEGDKPPQRRRRGQSKNKGRRGRPRKAQPAPLAAQPGNQVEKAIRARKARAFKVDMATAMGALAGLSVDDAKFLNGVVQAMQGFSKKSRQRIAYALTSLTC